MGDPPPTGGSEWAVRNPLNQNRNKKPSSATEGSLGDLESEKVWSFGIVLVEKELHIARGVQLLISPLTGMLIPLV